VRKRDREFIREVLREQRLISDRHLERLMREMRKDRAEMGELFKKQDRKLDEIIAEGKASREALFAILDRLQNGGATAG
jgi:hypothetical protein